LIIDLDRVKSSAALMLLAFLGVGSKLAAAQTSPVLTPNPHRVKRVLLLSLDGLHALDLANYVKVRPNSNLAQLSQHGITYKNARTSLPSNSWPGLLAMVTGGSPLSTGVIFENSYDRTLSPPGSKCASIGTTVVYDSSIDNDPNAPDGGGICERISPVRHIFPVLDSESCREL
jgi:hypothetical protein